MPGRGRVSVVADVEICRLASRCRVGFGLALSVQRAARQYPSADLTMMPAAVMAARRS